MLEKRKNQKTRERESENKIFFFHLCSLTIFDFFTFGTPTHTHTHSYTILCITRWRTMANAALQQELFLTQKEIAEVQNNDLFSYNIVAEEEKATEGVEEEANSIFKVEWELKQQKPSKQNVHILFNFLKILRSLDKNFRVVLETRRGSLVSYTPYLQKILESLNGNGVSKCLGLTLCYYDPLGIVKFLLSLKQKAESDHSHFKLTLFNKALK